MTKASTSIIFTLVFAALLVVGLVVKYWLATRQIRYVAQHRNAVPAAFAQNITLAAHQKAADYTLTKSRFGLLELAFGTAVLVAWWAGYAEHLVVGCYWQYLRWLGAAVGVVRQFCGDWQHHRTAIHAVPNLCD